MAITGTIYGSTGNQYIDAKIEWSYTQDTDANTSTVTATLYYKRNNTGYTTHGDGTFSITIGSAITTAKDKYLSIGTSWVAAVSKTETISHNDAGAKTITISASGSIGGTTLTSTTCSGSVTLATIPRASTITFARYADLGGTCSIFWKPLSKSFRYKLKFTLGNWSYTTGAIHPNATSTYIYNEYTFPLDVANQLPEAKTGTMTATLYTYSDSSATTQVGSASSKTFTVNVPNSSSTRPAVTMSLAPVHSLGSAFDSVYVQGKSKVQATLSATGKYSATISSYNMEALGKSDTSSPYQSDYLSTSGTVTVTGKAADSRGYIGSTTKNITVIPYSKPKVLLTICARCDESGELTESGTYLKIKAKRNYSTVTSSGVQKNFCSIRYRYKAESATSYSSWATILASDSVSSDEVETGALLSGALSATQSYMVQIGVIDTIGEQSVTTIIIPTDSVYMCKAGDIDSLGIGEYVDEPNTVSIAERLDVKIKGAIVSNEIGQGVDLNNLTKPNTYIGRYTYTPTYLNCPISAQSTFLLEVLSLGRDGQLLQRLTRCHEDATVYERQYYSATWHEWECVNPPMLEGVEYRTKERYLGKQVYTKLINFGSLPDGTDQTSSSRYKLVEHGAEGVTQAIRCIGQMSDGNSIPFHFSSTNWVEIYAGPQYVVIQAGDNKTSKTAYAQMWYVKD